MSELKILDRVRKLMQVTIENGATQSEMENAVKLAQQLMIRHNLDTDDVLVSAADIDITEIENEYEGHETKYWLWDLLMMIGKPYSCQIIKQKKYRKVFSKRWNMDTYEKYDVYHIIGTTEDRAFGKRNIYIDFTYNS